MNELCVKCCVVCEVLGSKVFIQEVVGEPFTIKAFDRQKVQFFCFRLKMKCEHTMCSVSADLIKIKILNKIRTTFL